ncbi:MAG: DUF2065 domain-containing protein [Gammaproteobacteria bacterium]|nr:DUF2065 domain-containing protein [Gammaproteobacteria bacterium]MCF6229696.1 DUF2065 domain-containing protein [Gammaproteobacteria bacterium]
MWNELLVAIALVLVIEGILPFVNPKGMRRAWATLAEMDDKSLRSTGLISMGIGVLLLYLVR